ncbi:MAG: hypothetical protein PHC78_11495, partial [Verrucomicrobiota bacterium]|nr:hypothetical protein [Verrucomicrobiota bacterium]
MNAFWLARLKLGILLFSFLGAINSHGNISGLDPGDSQDTENITDSSNSTGKISHNGNFENEEEDFASSIINEKPNQQNRWGIRLGAQYRWGMNVGISSGGNSRAHSLESVTKKYPPGIGNAKAYGNRTYDDGFVNVDAGTEFPGTVIHGLTWYWGYDNPSQYDGSREMLNFRKAGGERYYKKEISNDVLGIDKDIDSPGFSIELSREIAGAAFNTYISLGFNYFEANTINSSSKTFEGVYEKQNFSVIDSYD